MDNKTKSTDIPQKGNILIINTGSTTTKLGYFSDGVRVFDTKLEHTAEDVAKYPSVMYGARRAYRPGHNWSL